MVGSETWKSAGLLVARWSGERLLWLLIDSRLSKAAAAWEFPKSLIEPGEEFLAAAVRECWEETGIRIVPSRVDSEFHERVEWSMVRDGRRIQRTVDYFLATTDEEATRRGDWEVRDVRWFETAEALSLLRHEDLRRLLQRALYYLD